MGTAPFFSRKTGFYIVLTDQPGKNSWPIAGASFILIYKAQRDGAKSKTVLHFFDWAYKHGGDIARKLRYIPIPANVVELVENTWRKDVRANGQPVWK